MKHLIETTNPSGLATVPYDRIVLDSTKNDIIVKGGGYEYVDLGLPSGLKWAKCNVGAEKETDYGYYFQWGDIVDKSDSKCSWATYKHCNGSGTTLTKYCRYNCSSYGTVDDKTTLDLEDDAARANMGGDWRMPTEAEFQELINNTTKNRTQVNGVNGFKFTGSNGNYIFIPASGRRYLDSLNDAGGYCYVWSSSLFDSYSDEAYYFSNGYTTNDKRYFGMPVRGVFK